MGDCLITTNNEILLNNIRELPAIMCVQRKAKKKIINEAELAKSNKNSFGDAIGSVTNKITAMYDVQSLYPSDSQEYQDLSYRIMCGQLYQQNCIDATKGIIAKPMPKWWYNNRNNEISSKDNDEMIAKKKYNQTIVADKKPYFMNYIYPQQMAKYQKYIKTINTKCLSLFRINLNALLQKPDKTDEEREFIEWYYKMNPVSDNNCVMNRLCHMVEKEFEGYLPSIIHNSDFDYTILKSGIDYKDNIKKQIIDIYKQYVSEYQNFVISSKQTRMDSDDIVIYKVNMIETYRRKCIEICPNEVELCDIIIDICYTQDNSKKFAWDMCGDQIVRNLLVYKDNQFNYCVRDDNGNIEYSGKRYTAMTKRLEVK